MPGLGRGMPRPYALATEARAWVTDASECGRVQRLWHRLSDSDARRCERVKFGPRHQYCHQTSYTCRMAFTEADLREAVTHLAFDVQHYRCYLELDGNARLRQVCPAAGQAVHYCLLLHLRLLLNFFYGTPRQDDCCARHFEVLPGFSEKFQSKKQSPTKAEVEKVITNLNKRLAHLTANRWREPAPTTAFYQKYFGAVNELIDTFEAALPGSVRALFVEKMRAWQQNHPATCC